MDSMYLCMYVKYRLKYIICMFSYNLKMASRYGGGMPEWM